MGTIHAHWSNLLSQCSALITGPSDWDCWWLRFKLYTIIYLLHLQDGEVPQSQKNLRTNISFTVIVSLLTIHTPLTSLDHSVCVPRDKCEHTHHNSPQNRSDRTCSTDTKTEAHIRDQSPWMCTCCFCAHFQRAVPLCSASAHWSRGQ